MVISQRVRQLATPSEALVASLVGVPAPPACGVLGLGLVSRFPGWFRGARLWLGCAPGRRCFVLGGSPGGFCLFPPLLLVPGQGVVPAKAEELSSKSLWYKNGLYMNNPTFYLLAHIQVAKFLVILAPGLGSLMVDSFV